MSQRIEITDENAECYTYNGETATYDALTGCLVYYGGWTGEPLPLNGSITVETAGRFCFYLTKENITVRAWVVRA